MNNKQKKIVALSLSIVTGIMGITLAATQFDTNIVNALFTNKANADYVLNLNSSNAVTSNGDHIIKTARGNDVTFAYTNVSSPISGGHTTINDGGSIVNKDIIHSIESFTAIYSGTGTLKARLSYLGNDKWSDYFTVVSGQEVPTGSNPYFLEMKADGGAVNLSSAQYKFTCQVNSEAEEHDDSGTYDIKFADNGSDSSTALTYDTFWGQVESGDDYISAVGLNDKVYAGNGGLKLGSGSATGYLSMDFDDNYVTNVITTIDLSTKQYGTDAGKFKVYVNESSSYIEITPSKGGSVSVGGKLTSLEIETSAKRAYLCGITLNYGGKVEPGTPENPEKYVTGFTASDTNKDIYTTNSVFANENALSVKKIFSDGTEESTTDFTYVITDSNSQQINPNEKFPAEGSYTLTVSYGNYIPVEITLNVGEYVYVTDISAAMSKTTFNTADTLSTYLNQHLTATLEYSDDSTSSSISYAEFATNGIGVKLLNPKGISAQLDSPFGSAGTWTLKVYDLLDENMYYNISLTVNAIPVTDITLSSTSASLYVDDTLQLLTTITPDNATNPAVSWTSGDETIATVDENGLVTAVAVGGTIITATAADGSNVYGTCTVTVNAKPVVTEATLTITIDSFTDATTSYAWYNWSEDTSSGDTISGKGEIYKAANAANMQFNRNKGNKVAAIYNSVALPGGITKIEATTGEGSIRNWSAYVSSTAFSASGSTLNEGDNSTQIGSNIAVDTSSTSLGTSTAGYTYFCLQEETTSASFLSEIKITYGSAATPVTPVYPTSISLTGEKNSISIGETSQLTVGYTPNDTNVKEVTFSSNNESVATVSSTGLITGVSQGSATITATARKESGTTSATFNISVTPVSVTSVSLSTNSETVKVGKTVTLVATVSPSNATNPNLKWMTSSSAIATVDNSGVVTGVAEGEATITAFSDTDNDNVLDSGEKSATCTITVQASSAGGEETFSITYTDLPSAYSTSDTVYTAESGIKFQAYNCAGGYSSKMQFRASSGYLQNTESLELQSLTINDRESNTLTVYGSNTAGSFATEITGDNDVYDLTGYSYFKVARVASGAGYCSSLTIVTGTPTPTDPTGIIMSPTTAEVAAGGSKQLSISYVPSNANQNKEITWTSSNENVATVSSDGLVSVKSTATDGQTATITAKLTKFPSITATCKITVIEVPKADHTVLIYLCGADLESENQLATGDITEILKISNQPSDVHIVIETGGANSWSSKYGISSTNLERWHVENKSLVKDDSLTYASMGSSSTLQSFLEYGLKNYPAERTGVIFWNHGGGMRGVCYDEKKNDDVLKNSEIRSAVSGALSNCGMSGQKLEWVGYDACLMAVQDIAETNSDYFNYMVASEESEAGYGWDYDTWVDDLYSKKTTTTILKAIVDGFISDNGGASSSSGDQTLSYMNLAYAAAYKTAWENMAAQLNSVVTSSNKSSFNSAITSNVKHYGDTDYDYFCTFDAWDFVDKLANNSAFSDFRIDSSYTTAVKNAHANLVAYNLAQKGAGVSKGICMYWPNSKQYSDVSTYYTTSETRFTTWRSFCVNKGTHA